MADMGEDTDLEGDDLLNRFRVELGDDLLLDWSNATLGDYSSDASIYRVVPTVVARPFGKGDVIRLVRAALAVGMPVTARGAGTGISGSALGEGLIIDMGRYMNHIIDVDEVAQTATVEPGVVQSVLQDAVLPLGLRFGPDPGSADRCTIGGMIANNACGARALGYGRTSDNIVRLEVITGDGDLVVLGAGAESVNADSDALTATRQAGLDHLAMIRTEFGRFSRQSSGYALEHLLPEKGCAFEKFFAGTEGTLGIVLEATVKLVRDAPVQATIALGYPTMADAADDIVNLLGFHPTAAEGLDARIIDLVRRKKGEAAVPRLPDGEGFMFVEVVGDDAAEVDARAEALVAAAHCRQGYVERDAVTAKALWRLRTDAAGYASVALEKPAFGSWEDAAVPPAQLGAYLRAFDALLAKHGLHALPYGHFGEGCVHARIDFPFDQAGGVKRYRAFMEDAAALVAGFGGSMSGEHGDGRARSEFLPKMYSAEARQAFRDIKAAWDPQGLLNPGTIVDPVPTEADIRVAATVGSPLRRRDPAFVQAVHQCVGNGKCLADTTTSGGVMCPSYQATGDPFYSTRGRARMLQEMVNGSIVRGWRAPELLDALDLCLACKGCRRDCPTGVDMASHKSRVLHEAYRHRIRPVTHYTLGFLPFWGRLVMRVPGLARVVNLAFKVPGLGGALKSAAGIDPRRPVPRFRPGGSAVKGGSAPVAQLADRLEGRPEVAIWVDSFSESFSEQTLPALVKVLVAAGFAPRIITDDACCGLTWITTGQHGIARRKLRGALDVLAPIAESGVPIVGMEPSCMTVWKTDAPELLPDDARVGVVSGAIHTLAQLLATTNWRPPILKGVTVVAQPHCHQASVLGWQAEDALLRQTGAKVVTVGGCCGLAGNFGVEKGHYDISVKVFEHDLGPAIDEAGPDAVILADGFSCRKQVSDLAGRQAVTLAELLAANC
ncbi:MAG: FAD-binding oxidoreductase [Propionibacteriaceae bacterium]|nr:FAD-binding oxidoreductase [Propionibacteriaceae bacterium]